MYTGIKVKHQGRHRSDHALLKIKWWRGANNHILKSKLFKFEAMWLKHPECERVIKEGWRGSADRSEGEDIREKINEYGESLKKWNKDVFGNINY